VFLPEGAEIINDFMGNLENEFLPQDEKYNRLMQITSELARLRNFKESLEKVDSEAAQKMEGKSPAEFHSRNRDKIKQLELEIENLLEEEIAIKSELNI
jgi:ABC-type uncharacterized transport system fused permease/ATPase subunit